MKQFHVIAVLSLLLITTALLAVPFTLAQPESSDQPDQSASAVVQQLYDMVTFGPGNEPDWKEVKSLFIDDAIIALRTTREKTTVFTVDGFINDFKAFAQRDNVVKRGFKEEIIRSKTPVFGDIAHILVLYEASVPGSSRPATQGVDSIQLIKVNQQWRIFSITNELPSPNNPLPADLQG